jgi:hypothetical protein
MGGPCSTNGEKRNAYRLLVGKPEGKRPLERLIRRRVDNIRMDLGEIGDRLCGLVFRVLGYRSGGPSSIPATTRKKVVGLERGPLSLVSTTGELLDRKVAAPVWRIENTAVGIHYADHVVSSVGIVRSRTQTMEFFF